MGIIGRKNIAPLRKRWLYYPNWILGYLMDNRRFSWLALPAPPPMAELTHAALQCGRLAQALDNHALLPAILFRARLEAARRAAAADGQLIDPWHLAALLAGLRLRLDAGETLRERANLFAIARHALDVHQWLADPDFDQEGEIQRAEQAIAVASSADGPFLAAGRAMYAWIDADQPRQAMRTALARHWRRSGLFASPLPLIAAASLAAETPWTPDEWLPAFLRALATEASDMVQLTRDLERAWRTARQAIQGRRKTSHASAAVDVLAAAPLLSAPALAAALGIAMKNAGRLLDELCREGVAVEVTRRAKRRLYALRNMEPLRDAVKEPRRPELGRGRGRPPAFIPEDDEEFLPETVTAASRLPPVNFDYADLDSAMVELEQTIKRTRDALTQIGKKAG